MDTIGLPPDVQVRKSSSVAEVKSTAESIAWRRLQLARAKLKTSTRNSALLAGFAMIPMVEMEISDSHKNPVPLPLLIVFGVITTLLVAVHLSALMIASCILPHIDAVALSEERDLESITDSPHDKMVFFIEVSWIFSNIIGIVLFLSEIALLTWVKFWQIGGDENGEPGTEGSNGASGSTGYDNNRGKKVAYASTGVLVVSILFFIWYAIYFYRQLADHEFQRSQLRVNQLEQDFVTRRRFSVMAKKNAKGMWHKTSSILKPMKSSKKSKRDNSITDMSNSRQVRSTSITFENRF